MDPQIEAANEFVQQALADDSAIHLFPNDPGLSARAVVADHDRLVRQLRGRKMRDADGLYDEFAAAWQFNDLGPDIADLDEGLSDLYLALPTNTGYAVVILEAEQVLVDDDRLGWVVETFDFIQRKLGSAVDAPWPSGRPALSFDVFLVTNAEHRVETLRRWKAAGAPLDG